jgi:hypothetical protein
VSGKKQEKRKREKRKKSILVLAPFGEILFFYFTVLLFF